MIQNKLIKVLFCVLMVAIMLLGLCQNIIYATVQGPVVIKLSRERWAKDNNGVYESKKSYILNNASNHPIFQIAAYTGTNNSNVSKTNFYCLNATVGYTWNNETIGSEVTYNTGYDLVKETDAINNLNSTYSAILNPSIYKKVMWILDNMYVEGGISAEELLSNAGIVYGEVPNSDEDNRLQAYYYNSKAYDPSYSDKKVVWYWGARGYVYDYNDNRYNVLLSKEEIEAVQQAAIWYFTNYEALNNGEYNCYTSEPSGNDVEKTPTWFQYTENTTTDDVINNYIKSMKQEQAAILYNYLVNGAKGASSNYEPSKEATLTLAYTDSNNTINKDGTNYKIGPMKATVTGTVSNLSVEVATGTNYGTKINSTDVTLTNVSGTEINSIVAGQEFYVVVPQAKVDKNVQVTVSGKSTSTAKTLWISDSSNVEQPIVEVEKKTTNLKANLKASETKEFDLALRKIITEINGVSTETAILNENGLSATRNINISTSSIPDTATYYHRKDPVVVKTGNVITYQLKIYNEGEIDGYASKIVDKLANGLKMSSTMNSTVTSTKGNVYSVTYDSANNQIVLKLTSGNPVSLSAYSSALDSDTIEVKCEVTQKAETDNKTRHYLTNIAYIAEEYDKAGNKITQDRISESKPDNTDVTNKSNGLNVTDKNKVYNGSTNKSIFNETSNTTDYFAGQEDDDDFETVVVLPKTFDLALRKFITKVSKDGSFDSNANTYNREPQVDTSKLGTKDSSGKVITTATYNHSKEPLALDVEDYILYTLRVYNEGEVDGYAAEITDYLPEYLDFVDSSEEAISSVNSKWTYDATTRKVKTTALSTELLKAFDSSKDKENGEGLSYADVQIICKINNKAIESKAITNIAEISKYEDEDHNEIEEDIDSKSDDLKYPEDESKYKDDEIEKGDSYIPGQEDDDDFEKVVVLPKIFDLSLRKFITKVSANTEFNENTTATYNREPQVDTSKLGTTDSEGNLITTSIYNHSKKPIVLEIGDYILYTLRVYNEGEVDGYAAEITDYLPTYLDFVDSEEENIKDINSKWTYDATTRKVKTTALSTELLKAFDPSKDKGNGEGLSYADIQIICRINDTAVESKEITNIAEISKYEDKNHKELEKDIDSESDDLKYPEDESKYKDDEIEKGDSYIPGQEDDDDFEKVIIENIEIHKGVKEVKNQDSGYDANETQDWVITSDIPSEISEIKKYDIVDDIDYRLVFSGKDSVKVKVGNTTLVEGKDYKIDYSENEKGITDKTSSGTLTLTFIDTENSVNASETFSLNAGKELEVRFNTTFAKDSDGNILAKLGEDIENQAILEYTNSKNVNKIKKSENPEVHTGGVTLFKYYTQDDKEVALEGAKFAIYKSEDNAKNKKDAIQTVTSDSKGYVKFIGLEYGEDAMDSESNKTESGLYEYDSSKVSTDYWVTEIETPAGYKAKNTDPIKVTVNKDSYKEALEEIQWKIENEKVIFDLSLLKYVTTVIVTENGTTTTTKTGNTGAPTDIIPKVEINKKKLNSTVVKFKYTIKITNEGNIAGYAKEITDYVPEGLKFYSADNKGWKDEGNNVISTKLLENTLLQPGESATVSVTLRWINGSNNLGVKTNVAEISEDYNEEGVDDIDSTPDNKKEGEDDIDDASVLLAIKTGLTENIMLYVGGAFIVLVVLAGGIITIKKFVL